VACLDGVGWGDGDGDGGNGTIRRKSEEGSRIGMPEIYMQPYSPRVRASSSLMLASFLRPGVGERVRLITDSRKCPHAREGGDAQKPYQEIVLGSEIFSVDSDRYSSPRYEWYRGCELWRSYVSQSGPSTRG